ncbi:MAG: hypothetical protein K0S65_3479 [Labilithrix sp.]|nr:hypothetical protein [Labilithrix sp.]
MLRCMVVGLTTDQEEACRRAIVPVEVVRRRDVSEACASMSTVLPLVVVVDENISDADRAALAEFTTACGAELVTLDQVPADRVHAARLLEALRVAERRRLGARS